MTPKRNDRRSEALAGTRERILTGQLRPGDQVKFDTYSLKPGEIADVVRDLQREGLVKLVGENPHVASMNYAGATEVFLFVWSLGRTALRYVKPEHINRTLLEQARAALREATPDKPDHDSTLKFMLAFATAIGRLFESVKHFGTPAYVGEMLRRLHLLDPDAFNPAGIRFLAEEYSVLVTQLESETPDGNTVRHLFETIVQHMVECWSLEVILSEHGELFKHGRLTLPRHTIGPRISML